MKYLFKIKSTFKKKWKERKFGHIGKKCQIIKPIRIIGRNNIFLGDYSFFLNGARIETITHNRKQGKLIIGKNTSFQQSCHVIAAGELIIGNDCVFSSFVYVSDCSHTYSPDIDIAKGDLVIKRTSVGDHCFIGCGARIMPGVNIGNNCVVGANAVVTHDVPPYSMVAGVPAKIIKRYNLTSNKWELLK